MVSADDILSILKRSTRYVADGEGDVPLCALPYISGTSLQEQVLALASLKDDDCGLVISEHMEKLMYKLGSPQRDGQSSIGSLKVTNGRVAPEYTGRESSMLCSASCEGWGWMEAVETGLTTSEQQHKGDFC